MVYKKIITIVFLVISSVFLLSQIMYFDDFAVTDLKYTCISDWNEIVNNLFEGEYRVADWTDIKDYYNSGGDLEVLLDELGLKEYQSEVFVTLNGDPSYSSSRFYYLSRHNHNKPSGYLAHQTIDNHFIDLGSWKGERKILAIKKESADTCSQEYGIVYRNFGITGQKYPFDANWDEIVFKVFGPEYRVADWQDIVDYFSTGEDILDIFDGLFLNEYKSEAFIKLYGDSSYNSGRAYYISRHNHNKPSGYMTHQTIDNHLIDLGSWTGERPILAIKRDLN